MLDILNNDAWAAIGQHLDPISLCCLASTCMGSHKDISSNSALWRGQAQKRWPALFSDSSVDTITNWYKAYHAVHKASCEVSVALFVVLLCDIWRPVTLQHMLIKGAFAGNCGITYNVITLV
jgi:hypothetical protein